MKEKKRIKLGGYRRTLPYYGLPRWTSRAGGVAFFQHLLLGRVLFRTLRIHLDIVCWEENICRLVSG